MKYRNATKVLPDDLLEQLQQYVQGEYIYVPIKERAISTHMTDYEIEAIPYVMKAIELLFAAWFLKQKGMKCKHRFGRDLCFLL